MTSHPLKGIDLLNCAQANAKEGLEASAQQCGYGDNVSQFAAALQEAAREKGLKIESLSDLVDTKPLQAPTGETIAPDSLSDL